MQEQNEEAGWAGQFNAVGSARLKVVVDRQILAMIQDVIIAACNMSFRH